MPRCASHVATTTTTLRPLVRDGKYDLALQRIEFLNSGTSRLLYHYERGLLLHQQQRFEDSNAAFDLAEELYGDLYTRSVSRETGALLLSEVVREYRGERFEASLVHYYKIMNYLRLGDLEDAAVECRRLDHRLDVFAGTEAASYRGDPFLRYLTGLVYAANGDRNDADVSLRLALEGYRARGAEAGPPLPGRLLCDLAANATALGATTEARAYREEGSCPPSRARATGTLRLFLECGEVAFKNESSIVLPIFKSEIQPELDRSAYANVLVSRYGQAVPPETEVEYLLRISMPVLVETPSGIVRARIIAAQRPADAGGDTVRTAISTVAAMDLNAFARRAFEEAQPALLLRATVRGLAKYLASREAEKRGGEGLGWAVNLIGLATETADTRCWSTLPESIQFATLDLAPGTYDLTVELYDRGGSLDFRFELPGVAVEVAKETFLAHRVY